jgi:hypothetical protein
LLGEKPCITPDLQFQHFSDRVIMSINTKVTEITSLFSPLSFKNLEGVNIGELLAAPAFSFLILGNSLLSYRRLFKTTLSFILKHGYKMNACLNPKYLFCFTNSYGKREDYISFFNKVKSLTQGNVEINPCYRIRFKFKRIISIVLLFIWIYQIKSTKLPYKTRWYFCNQILLAYMDSNEIFDMLSNVLSNIRLVVTFCDIHAIDYMLTHWFKRIGVPTATVEHGNYIAGWHFGNSHSDYFLAHGEFAREQAIISGLKPDKVIVVGMMQHIHEDTTQWEQPSNTSIFGVFLNSSAFEKDNATILGYVNWLAKKFNLKYAVRYHPALNRAAYISLIDKSCLSSIDGNMGTVADFSRKIEFAVVGTSTTFMELLRLAVPVFRFPNEEEDFYPTITKLNFKSHKELDVLYNSLKNEKENFVKTIMQASEFLCPAGDAAHHYKAFFDRFA